MTRVQLAGLALTAAAVLVLLGSLVANLGQGEESPAESGDAAAEEEARVRVEVLNAAGIPGLARTATEQLRDQGLDVVYYGNASNFGRDTSLVLDRVGSPEAAERVAEVLDIGRVRTERDSTLYLDVTVVLGRDWAEAEETVEDAPADSVEQPEP